MPAINKAKYATTNNYRSLEETARDKFSEDKDCAVKALAVACEITYDEAHQALKQAGRGDGESTPFGVTLTAVSELGFKLIEVDPQLFINDYPGVHRGLKNVTTHHPDRFNEVWADGQTYLFMCTSHILGVKDGTVHDWTRGRAMRVKNIYAVVKKSAKTSKYLKSRGAA